MGRHSAGDDDAVDPAAATSPAAAPAGAPVDPASSGTARHGRHASAERDADDQPTQVIAIVDPDAVPGDRHDTDVLDLPPGFADHPPAGAGSGAPMAVPYPVGPVEPLADP